MVEPVKRPYRSTVREEQAAATRERIRGAATSLFVADGYAATSMRAVAEAAGVGERTLYVVHPSKAALFAHCIGVALVGDEAPVRVLDRPALREALDAHHGTTALSVALTYGAQLLERAGDLVHAGTVAAESDPDLRAMRDAAEADTLTSHRRLVRRLHGLDALAHGLTTAEATDRLYAVASPEVWHLLRRRRRWSAARYRSWLLETASTQLLG